MTRQITILLYGLTIFYNIHPMNIQHQHTLLFPFSEQTNALQAPQASIAARKQLLQACHEQRVTQSGLSHPDRQRLLGYYRIKTLKTRGGLSCILTACYSPDGCYLAAGCADGSVQIWKISTTDNHKHPQQILSEHAGHIRCLSFSPDSRYLIATDAHAKIAIWETTTWSCNTEAIKAVPHNYSNSSTLSFSPDGNYFTWGWCTGNLGRESYHWAGSCYLFPWNPAHLASNTCIIDPARARCTTSTCFSPNGRFFAAGLSNGKIYIANTERLSTMRSPTKMLSEGNSTVDALSFSPDGHYLASASSARTLRIWNMKTITTITEPFAMLTFGHRIRAMSFAPHNDELMCARGKRIYIYSPYFLLSPDYIDSLINYYRSPLSFYDLSVEKQQLFMKIPKGARPRAIRRQMKGAIAWLAAQEDMAQLTP